MSAIALHYKTMDNTCKHLETAAGKMEGYASKLQAKVINAIGNLPGRDHESHAYNALNSASWHKNGVDSASIAARKLRSNIIDLKEYAKDSEKRVVQGFKIVIREYKKGQGFLRQFADFWIGVWDRFSQNNAITRFLNNAFKVIGVKLSEYKNIVLDYFKYGKGKYIFNIVKDIALVAITIGAFIVAIASIPASGGLTLPIVIAGIGVIAKGTKVMTAVVDLPYSLEANIKAYQYHDTDRGAASYLSKIDGVSEYVRRTDMGSAERNEQLEKAAKAVDVVDFAADITSLGTDIYSKFVVFNVDGQAIGYSLKGGGTAYRMPNNQPGNHSFSFTDKNGAVTYYQKVRKGTEAIKSPMKVDLYKKASSSSYQGKLFELPKKVRSTLAAGDNIKTGIILYEHLEATHRNERWNKNDPLIDNLTVKQDVMETGLDLLERIAPGLKDLIKGGTLMIDGIKLPSA